MKFIPLKLEGAYLIEPELLTDERGFFARSFCKEEFKDHELAEEYVQCSISFNKKKGTLRGMHFQKVPHEEIKLIRCTRGVIHDVIIDIRKESKTLGQWLGFELSEDNHSMLYIPDGFAHGFITLSDNAEIQYQISTPYNGASAEGIRWNDPSFNISWPLMPQVISERDRNFPDYSF